MGITTVVGREMSNPLGATTCYYYKITRHEHAISFCVLYHAGLADPTGNCSAGYYCNTTSSVPDQHVCPQGAYCPIGTGIPELCPPGTWSDAFGNSELTDCTNCTGGKYCQGKNGARIVDVLD